jgi:hypothetical protein
MHPKVRTPGIRVPNVVWGVSTRPQFIRGYRMNLCQRASVWAAALAAALVTAACASTVSPGPSPRAALGDTSHQALRLQSPELLAAGFRQLLIFGQSGDSKSTSKSVVACLGLGSGFQPADPPDTVIQLLKGAGTRFLRASDCAVNDANPRIRLAVAERSTGQRGWLLAIDSFVAQPDGRRIIRLSYYVEPLYAAGWICQAEKVRGRWIVRDCKMSFIS